MCMKICGWFLFLYVRIIWICKCDFLFFLPYAWLPPPLVHHVFILATSLCCTDFFVWFCSPVINQISLSQSKAWFPFILLCRWEKYHWTGPLGLCINYNNRIIYICQGLIQKEKVEINCENSAQISVVAKKIETQ